jgi:hypothetical protein
MVASEPIILWIQQLATKSPILDTVGVGDYGPRGFEGGEKRGIP